MNEYWNGLTDQSGERARQVSQYFGEIIRGENIQLRMRVGRRAYWLFKKQPALTLYLGSVLTIRKLERIDQDTFNDLAQRMDLLIEPSFADAQSLRME